MLFRMGLVLILLAGCGPSSSEDFKEQGKTLSRHLLAELQSIHSRDELTKATPRFQMIFDEMVSVMIATREFAEKHPKSEMTELNDEDHHQSEELRFELNRIYKIDGCREIIEKSQRQPLQRLDIYEKRREKKRMRF